MGFTRSNADLKIIQKLSDYPNMEDGLSSEELKKKFDEGAEIVQADLNKVIDELEEIYGAANVGAEPLDENDPSDNNVQAKLNQLRKEIQDMALGQIADGTITKAKLDTEYANGLAEKNGEMQTNLNAEMLNGIKLDELASYLIKTGSFDMSTTTQTINLGFTPRCVIIDSGATRTGTSMSSETAMVTTEKPTYKYSNSSKNVVLLEIVENGFNVTGINSMMDGEEYGTGYRYIAYR